MVSDGPLDVDPETALRVMRPMMWLLQRAGSDGLPLTKAGRLRPADVSALMVDLGWEKDWIGKYSREEQTLPAWWLREATIFAKLLYKRSGRLHLTPAARKIANDPVALWFFVAEQLPVEKDRGSRLAANLGLLHLLAVVDADPALPVVNFEPAEILTHYHWGNKNGQPLTSQDARNIWLDTRDVLAVCGVVSFLGEDLDVATKRAFLRSALTEPVADNVGSLTPSVRRARMCHTFTIELLDISPPIWRTVRVPSTSTLLQLHHAIQAAMGWTNSHLFQFEFQGSRFGYPDPEFGGVTDAKTVKVKDIFTEVGQAVEYEYDFGDTWLHSVTVNAIEKATDYPTVIAGERACPPEDCGGVYGYERLCEVMQRPDDSEAIELREWLGGEYNPEHFELEDADRAIRMALLGRS